VCEWVIDRFGIHERIVDFYLDNKNWDDTHYYLQDLLSNSFMDCDLALMESIKATKQVLELKDYPPGCRVFVISNLMKKQRRDIKEYEALLKTKKADDIIADFTDDTYVKNTRQYNDYAQDILDILKHLIVDERYKSTMREREHQKHLDLYNCALRAKDQGFNVETGVGTALEQGFEKAAELSGLTPKTLEARKRHEKLLKKPDKTKFEKKEAQLLLELENDFKHAKSASEKELIKKQINRIKTMEVK